MKAEPYFPEEIAAVYRAIYERRDMRHFLPDAVEPETLQRLLHAAHHAPSGGDLFGLRRSNYANKFTRRLNMNEF